MFLTSPYIDQAITPTFRKPDKPIISASNRAEQLKQVV